MGGLVATTGLFVFACLQSSGQSKPAGPSTPTFAGDVKPLISKYCLGCHAGSDASAGLDLEKLLASPDFVANQETWGKIQSRLSTMQMPPAGSPKPADAARGRVLTWLTNNANQLCKLSDPGKVTIRRLNREEYNNTVRDLTGLNLHPADEFPSDDVGYGFDNIGDVLTISSLLMEKYISASEKVGDAIIPTDEMKPLRFDPSMMSVPKGASIQEDAMFFFTNAESTTNVNISAPGRYTFRVNAGGDLAGPDAPNLAVSVDGEPVAQIPVDVDRKHAKDFECAVNLPVGKHRLGLAFTNDYYNLQDPPGKQDRNLLVYHFELDPVEVSAPKPTAAELKVIPQVPLPGNELHDARQDIAKFATKAYRRPVTTDEMDRLMALYKLGAGPKGDFRAGVKLAAEATLVSPNFLFRVELDPKATVAAKVRNLNDYELASRLSYFLWSSMPDDELFRLAKQGTLHNTDVLNAQVRRMIADPRANALADNFAGQWLQLRKLAIVYPDKKRFPGIDSRMKADMATETKMFFSSVLRDDRPITDFIDGKYTYVNERLAKLYEIDGVTGDKFQRVNLTGERGGVLTQASVLLVTSNPTRTSPTKRGKWVLEQILGTPPPPPPPGVGQIADENKKITATSLRQLMDEHRKNPMCAACHAKMDPIGFGLENFDAVGRWRTKDGDFALDTAGTLPSGLSFKGPEQLKQILLKDKASFAHALAEKLLTYALGRGPEPSDKCALDAIVKQASAQDDRFTSLIIDVVDSDPFRKRSTVKTK